MLVKIITSESNDVHHTASSYGKRKGFVTYWHTPSAFPVCGIS